MNNFLSGKIYLTLVIIQKILNEKKFFNETNRKVIGKMKDEFGEVIITELVELNSEMYPIKSIATEFDKFKDVLFNKKNY